MATQRIAGVDPGSQMPGLPGQPNVFAPDWGPDAGLPPLMANDRVPVDPSLLPGNTPTPEVPLPSPTPAQQDAMLPTGGGARQGRGGSFSMEPGRLGWAVGSDAFFPAGFKPNESRSTQVGKYGGSPLYAATMGYPDAVIASRLQGIALERKQLNEALASFDPMKGIEEVEAPEYRDSVQRAVMADMYGMQGDVYKMWGREKGLQRLMDTSTEEGRKFRERGMHWTNVVRLMNQSTKSALAVTSGMDNGTLEYNPYLYEKAFDLQRKQGEWSGKHDPEALAKEMTVFTGVASLDDQVHKDGIVQLLKNAGNTNKIVELVKQGEELYVAGFQGILEKKTTDREAVADTLADRYWPRYRNYMSKDEIKKYFRSLAASLSEESLKLVKNPSSGDETPANPAANYSVVMSAFPEGVRNAYGKSPSRQVVREVEAEDGTKSRVSKTIPGMTDTYPTIMLFGSSNKQAKLANPLTFRYGKQEVFMYPEQVKKVGDRYEVVGKEVGMPRTRAEVEAMAKKGGMTVEEAQRLVGLVQSDPGSEEARSAIQRFGTLQAVYVPLAGNEAQIEGLGYNVNHLRQVLDSHPGRRQAEAFIDPTKPDEADFNKAWDAAKPGDTILGPDGKKYRKP